MFWTCDYIYPLWISIQDICYNNIDMEDFSMFKCLLSNFQNPLMCLITIIVKYYIHVSRCVGITRSLEGILLTLQRYRNKHYMKCHACNNSRYYNYLWDAFTHDILFNEEIKKARWLDNG